MTTTITVASSDAQLKQILALQRRYHKQTLNADEQRAEGFVFAEHTLPLLKRMSAKLPQAIALVDNQVVGYCLSLSLSLQSALPNLAAMFAQFERCSYRGKPLVDYPFFVGGQVCVDRAYRGQHLMSQLYHQIQQSLQSDYDLCVTEIAARNNVSVCAHKKMGFEIISTYTDEHEEWVIVAWDLKGAV
ncbi:MAG: GNAT family N-acetyltransferase [Deinococcota bacterium]